MCCVLLKIFYFAVSIRDEILYFVKQLKAFTLGPFNPSINVLHWLELVLNKHLPSNAHKLASGRLAVAMTRMADNKLIIMSDFESKEDVLQVSGFSGGYLSMLYCHYINLITVLSSGFAM